jgi:hypothetical protein
MNSNTILANLKCNDIDGTFIHSEGCLTKAPSDALSMVANMSAEVKVQQSVPLEELFMIGVTPAQQDRVMTPSRARSAKDDRMKVSNQCELANVTSDGINIEIRKQQIGA